MEVQISQLSNDDLFEKLKFYGIAKGPVTNTTRSIYEKKLIQHLQTSKVPDSAINNSSLKSAASQPTSVIPAAIPPQKPSPPKLQNQAPIVVQQRITPTKPDIIDVTPNKIKNTIRIQTEYDPLVSNHHLEEPISSYSSSGRTPQKPQQPQPVNKPKFEFKLLNDQTLSQPQQSNSSINISPVMRQTVDEELSNIRLRQATHTTYVSDQIDQARLQQQQQQQQNRSSYVSNETQTTSFNWRLYAILIAVSIIIIVFYNFFLSGSTDFEELDD